MEGTFKAVILHGFTNEEALAAMRALKSAAAGAKDAAFATTTPSNIDWKVSSLLEHLEEEHTARRAAITTRRTDA